MSSQSTWFSDAEVKGLDPRLVALLDRARGLAKTPFFITSGLRTAEANESAAGVHDSAHLRGLAVDLACTSSVARMRIVSAALLSGFKRIGIYNLHVHLDCDDSLPQEVMWIGVSH